MSGRTRGPPDGLSNSSPLTAGGESNNCENYCKLYRARTQSLLQGVGMANKFALDDASDFDSNINGFSAALKALDADSGRP